MSNEFKLSYTANDINTRLGYLDGITENVQDQLENVTYSTVLAMKGSLKWDGVVGDKTTVTVEQGDGGLVQLVHIYDEVPVITYPMALVGITQVIMPFVIPVEEFEVMDDGFAMIGEGFVIVPYDNYSMEGLTFPKKGIYAISYTVDDMFPGIPFMYASALLLIGYSFSDNSADKYFESGSSITDVLTFDGNIGDKTKVIAVQMEESGNTVSGYYVQLSSSVPTASDVVEGMTISFRSENTTSSDDITASELMFGEDGYLNLDSILLIIPSDGYTITNPLGEEALVIPKKGIYTICIAANGESLVYTTSLSIPNYTFQVDGGKVLKAAHLPEPIIFDINDTANITCNKTYAECKANPYQQFFFKKIIDGATRLYHGMVTGINPNGSLGYASLGVSDAIQYNPDGTITLVD